MVRKADILDDLLENGYRSVPDLALAFGVDASTIRRHLARLEKLNLVQRTHGGALPIRHADTPFAVKQSLHTSEKVAIGTAMAARIEDGQTVLLDSGSTTLEVAKRLSNGDSADAELLTKLSLGWKPLTGCELTGKHLHAQ